MNVTMTNLRVWHERLGHINERKLRELVEKGLVKGIKLTDKSKFFCDFCQFGKSHRQPFKKNREKVATKPGEFIHTDVCGPMSEDFLGGMRFFLTLKDDATNFRYVYFMKHKSDVFECFKKFDKEIENKFGQPIKTLRSDNGREFSNEQMDKYLVSRGIRKENTAPYTPEQNGKAERDNRTIVESARTLIHAKDLPKNLWAEAVNTAVYLLNRAGPSSACESTTPYEK